MPSCLAFYCSDKDQDKSNVCREGFISSFSLLWSMREMSRQELQAGTETMEIHCFLACSACFFLHFPEPLHVGGTTHL